MVWPPVLPTPAPVSTPSMLLRISAMEVARIASISARGRTLIEAGAWVMRCSKPAAVTTTSATWCDCSRAAAASSARTGAATPVATRAAAPAIRSARREEGREVIGKRL
ncbi:hypothetical protein D3C77_285680 [compost metagenome]